MYVVVAEARRDSDRREPAKLWDEVVGDRVAVVGGAGVELGRDAVVVHLDGA